MVGFSCLDSGYFRGFGVFSGCLSLCPFWVCPLDPSDILFKQVAERFCHLGVFQRPLTLILLQQYYDTNGRHIVTQTGGAYMLISPVSRQSA